MNRTTVNLTPSYNSLQGEYFEGDTVLVMCDATDGDFSITMPDAQSSDESEFRFVKKDNSLNVLTLVAKPGQKIMDEDTQELHEQNDELVLNSDRENWY